MALFLYLFQFPIHNSFPYYFGYTGIVKIIDNDRYVSDGQKWNP